MRPLLPGAAGVVAAWPAAAAKPWENTPGQIMDECCYNSAHLKQVFLQSNRRLISCFAELIQEQQNIHFCHAGLAAHSKQMLLQLFTHEICSGKSWEELMVS